MNKKIFFAAMAAVAATAVISSCSKNSKIDNPAGNKVGEATISATLPDLNSKVAFTPTVNGGKPESMALTWGAGDKLRVYDHNNTANYADFTLDESCIGSTAGQFKGDPANIASATAFDVQILNSSIDYAEQSQPADGVTSYLKYFASVENINNYSYVVFNEFSSVLAISAKMPEGVAADIASIDITADADIFNGGKTLTIALDSKGDAGDDDILNFYATMPKGNTAITAGTTLLVHFNAPETDHTVYTRFVTLDESAFTEGKLNTININATKSDLHAGLATCDGSNAAKAYLIGDMFQMQAIDELATAGNTTYFKMIDDVDLTDVAWLPVNDDEPYDQSIVFDGGNHTISKLSCSSGSYPSFAGVLCGEVNNVTFKDANISSGGKCGVVAASFGLGSVKAACSNVIIDNATVASSKDMCGGFGSLGGNVGSIENCQVKNSNITGTSRAGALFGAIQLYDHISGCACTNNTVTATYYSGGLVGYIISEHTGDNKESYISNCSVTGGTVKSTHSSYSRSGGFIGRIEAGAITNCYSTSTVTPGGGQFPGGFAGEVSNATISKCFAVGDITSTNHYAGGLVGRTENVVTIEKCYYKGAINISTGKAQAGGIVSKVDVNSNIQISNCYSTGSITGRRWCGCIVGGIESGAIGAKVNNCYSTMTITGSPSGAIVGNNVIESTTCQNNIVWWASGNIVGTGNAISSGCYIGQEGTISAKATELGWDTSIWDLTGNTPVLKDMPAIK